MFLLPLDLFLKMFCFDYKYCLGYLKKVNYELILLFILSLLYYCKSILIPILGLMIKTKIPPPHPMFTTPLRVNLQTKFHWTSEFCNSCWTQFIYLLPYRKPQLIPRTADKMTALHVAWVYKFCDTYLRPQA